MSIPGLDRSKILTRPLAERENRVTIERDRIDPETRPGPQPQADAALADVAARIQAARHKDRPVIIAFGAHTIKNGLGPVLIKLMEEGWLSHLATNGAGVIHDWEFAFAGQSSEHVQRNVAQGWFGNWEETGRYINLALAVGAYEGQGYGEAVGAFIHRDGLEVPAPASLKQRVHETLDADPGQAAAAADLLELVTTQRLKAGWWDVAHPWKRFSVQAAAFRLGVPFTGHPMIGHDVIYNHPMNRGAAVGRAALRDFLAFAASVGRLEGGVYLSVGSAVMSPMIFEKSLSMAQNLALQEQRQIQHHSIVVVDLAVSDWDWSRGEPPEDHPAYYQRYNKSFSRMGGHMQYLAMDNRDFLLHLWHRLGHGRV